MKTYEGKLNAKGLKLAIVISRFNSFISEKLLAGALDCLIRHEAQKDLIEIVWVPGAFEISLVVKKLASSKKFDGVIALGVIIRGQTPHFDYVAGETAKGLAQVALSTDIPVGFGIVTADTLEQAIDRAGAKAGNKGWDTAQTIIEMANLYKSL